MRIATYCIAFPEEYDIITNMVRQARKLGDVWVIDGGPTGHLCHHPRDINSHVLLRMSEEIGFIYTKHPWPGNPGEQRNWALEAMRPHNYDWIIQNDADEFWPDQEVERIPAYLESLPPKVTNVLVNILPLVEDEHSYSRSYAHYLSHARIHRPGAVEWSKTWHEHQFFEGERVKSDLWLVHTNWLFIGRLNRIKGHGLEGWTNPPVDKLPIKMHPRDFTWPQLDAPDDDKDRVRR